MRKIYSPSVIQWSMTQIFYSVILPRLVSGNATKSNHQGHIFAKWMANFSKPLSLRIFLSTKKRPRTSFGKSALLRGRASEWVIYQSGIRNFGFQTRRRRNFCFWRDKREAQFSALKASQFCNGETAGIDDALRGRRLWVLRCRRSVFQRRFGWLVAAKFFVHARDSSRFSLLLLVSTLCAFSPCFRFRVSLSVADSQFTTQAKTIAKIKTISVRSLGLDFDFSSV